jgi:hypothetical protein
VKGRFLGQTFALNTPSELRENVLKEQQLVIAPRQQSPQCSRLSFKMGKPSITKGRYPKFKKYIQPPRPDQVHANQKDHTEALSAAQYDPPTAVHAPDGDSGWAGWRRRRGLALANNERSSGHISSNGATSAGWGTSAQNNNNEESGGWSTMFTQNNDDWSGNWGSTTHGKFLDITITRLDSHIAKR